MSPDGEPPRHEEAMPASDGDASRTRRVRLILAMAGVLVLLSGLAFGGWALRDQPGTCDGKPLVISVASAPDIAPAVHEVASRFNARAHEVRGRCVRVGVTERESAAVTRTLAQPASGELPDGWIAESSIWVDLARSSPAGSKALSSDVTSAASSPVVLATTGKVAGQVRAQRKKPGWRLMFPKFAQTPGEAKLEVTPRVPDPAANASGIAAMVAARQLIKDDKKTAAVLTSVVRGIQRDVPANSAVVLNDLSVAKRSKPLAVVPEQAVIGYNTTHRQEPATVLTPREGTYMLDYPFAATATDPLRREAAESFRSTLRSRLSQDVLRRHGFRTPEGTFSATAARDFKVSPRAPKLLPKVQPGQVAEALQAWNRLGLGSRILVVADVSGSMAQEAPGTGKTRMQVAQEAATTGLKLFPGDTDIGLWEFSTELAGKKDYKQLVSLGPIDDKLGKVRRRARIQQVALTLKPRPQGNTGLYDSVLAAHRKVRQTWKPEKFNAVLVLTDGNNDDDHGVDLKGLLNKLRTESDPQRPIQVIIVAFGPDIDPEPMKQIAQATNGSSYVTKNPGDIVNVFMEAIGRRLCSPNCPSRR